MIRLYDTSKGIIPTDEENNCLRKPGYILIVYVRRGPGVFGGGYTREVIENDNLVEIHQKDTKIRYDLKRLMDTGPITKRSITITEEAYHKTVLDYEHPGCFGQIARALRIRKSLDEMLREHFKH